MSVERAKPADILLDMLRGARKAGRSTAYLIDTGRLFGFTDNTVRVTLSRLQARGLIESPTRGSYRLAETADPVNEFVERWRLGEARVRDWDGITWLFLQTPTLVERSSWALTTLGFRAEAHGVLVRPDNLTLDAAELLELARGLGLKDDVLLTVGRAPLVDAASWQALWPCTSLDDSYREMAATLKASAARLEALTTDEARLESFRLGGAGIRLLAKDPLLPGSFVDCQARAALWQMLCDYDAVGTQIWAASKRETDGTLPVSGLMRTG